MTYEVINVNLENNYQQLPIHSLVFTVISQCLIVRMQRTPKMVNTTFSSPAYSNYVKTLSPQSLSEPTR